MRFTLMGVVFLAGAQFCADALSPPPPRYRIAPIGWETRITPGFDPPIEYEIVYGSSDYSDAPGEAQKKAAETWGPAAFEPLRTLADDPGWKEYRPTILGLMESVKSPESRAYFVEIARQSLADAEVADADLNVLGNDLMRVRRVAPEEFDALFEERFPGATPKARLALLRTYSFGLGDDAKAEACAARLRDILQSTADGKEKQLIEQVLANYTTRLRADEPMQRVLDIERGKVSKP